MSNQQDSSQVKELLKFGKGTTGKTEYKDKFQGKQNTNENANENANPNPNPNANANPNPNANANPNPNPNESNINQNQNQKIIENPLYLFVVIHKFDSSTTSITSNIINVFETNDNEFKLGKTYKKAKIDIEYNINIKNFITVNEGKLFQSRINKTITPRIQDMMVNETHSYNVYNTKKIEPIVKIEDNECIFFY